MVTKAYIVYFSALFSLCVLGLCLRGIFFFGTVKILISIYFCLHLAVLQYPFKQPILWNVIIYRGLDVLMETVVQDKPCGSTAFTNGPPHDIDSAHAEQQQGQTELTLGTQLVL